MFRFDRIQQKLLLVLCVAFFALSGFLICREIGRRSVSPAAEPSGWEETGTDRQEQTVTLEEDEPEESGKAEKPIKVYLTGQVKSPGVLTLSEGARVEDAIELAGGTLPDADLDRINLARKLKDEGMYHVPAVGEEISDNMDPDAASAMGSDAKVNINEADQAQLETLNGIGPSKAQKIIQYREENGDFQSIEELMNVSGIGEKTFEGLREQIDA